MKNIEYINKKRPFFITVLGILGFIEIALSLESGILKLFTGISLIPDKNLKNINGIENVQVFGKVMNNASSGLDKQLDYTNKLLDNSLFLGLIYIAFALISLLGIIWMWKLQRKGYYVYIIGEIVPVIAIIALAGFNFAGTIALLGMILPVIFIILWGLNLKHMS